MQWLFTLNHSLAEALEEFLASAVPLDRRHCGGQSATIIVLSLAKASYHYLRVMLFHDSHDFHHEMSSGLTTALEFLMSGRDRQDLSAAQPQLG